MGIQNIGILPIPLHMPKEVQLLRKNAPFYIKSIIERSKLLDGVRSINDLSSVKALKGGMLSAVYLLKKSGQSLVINFRHQGIDATVEAYSAWQKTGANIVPLITSGSVSDPKMGPKKVKYLVLEGMVTDKGQPAKTCQQFVLLQRDKALEVGKKLGLELAKIHRAKADRYFGEYADMSGHGSVFRSWNSYLVGYIKKHFKFLQQLGLSDDQLLGLEKVVLKTKFSKIGYYVHGDFSMRNAMVVSENPLEVKIFDPNPLIGDPTWDIAILFNNVEFSRRKYISDPKNRSFQKDYQINSDCLEGFLLTYEKVTDKQVDRHKVLLSQIMQMIFLLQIEQEKARHQSNEIEVRVRKEALISAIENVSKKM